MPQQNEVAEHKSHHLLDVNRTLLLVSFVPPRFRFKALPTTVYLINYLPFRVLDFDSPFPRVYPMPPSYRALHAYGRVCFVYFHTNERHKHGAQEI